MELARENQLELAIASPTLSFQDLLDSQKELFISQIDQLQNIVLTQCKLTGVNPLSQEMAAGALSIKIGKRPRDLLNPKAIKYMQSVFSIKDAVSKRESREISALFGVTVTQVREFFTTQRSRVRKFVRLSREKALRSSACKEVLDGVPLSSDPDIPIDPVPLNSVDPANVEQGSSCPTHDEVIPGINDSDKYFLDNIFSMMRKEETFSGQVKLLEWILQIRNASVLYCFLTRGGVMILATWLSQAAAEEQTSVLHCILKVLCHLPLRKALPVHMSAILQSVNRLRFYRTSDISNRARILLSTWSKAFARSQALKKPNAMKSSSDAHDEMLLKQSIGEVMSSELWESNADFRESLNLPNEGSENHRKLETLQPMKLLTASSDDSDRKLMRGASSSKTRERRKVLLVEQPGQKTAGRNPQASRSVPAIPGRPLSADDIQKAKMRAQFMQNKYGKSSTASEENIHVKFECLPKCNSSPAGIIISPPKDQPRPKIEELRKPVKLPSVVSCKPERHLDSKMGLDAGQPLVEKYKWVQIPWKTPPEITITGAWSVGTGDNGKEVEVQKNRMCREKEIIYKTVQEIPANPREPWDREIDYDDTLTPEIPTEQLPDADGAETGVSSSEIQCLEETPAPLSSQNGNVPLPEPDLELLAVLLKNPELVFALTSGKAGGMSSEETVKLLDMIKAQGASPLDSMSGLGRKAEEKVEVCLPSPTPSTDPVTSGRRQEFAKNPFSRQNPLVTGSTHYMPGVVTVGLSQQKGFGGSLAKPQIPTATFLAPEHLGSLPQLSQPAVAQFPLSHSARVMVEQHPPLIPSLQPQVPTNSLNMQGHRLGPMSNMNTRSVSSMAMPNLLAATSPPSHLNYVTQPSPILEKSVPGGLAARMPLTAPAPPQPRLAEAHDSNQSWIARQGLALNSPYQANQNNYNALVGQMKAGPSWDRNEFVGGPEFESWSPENSPMRSEYMPGMNYAEPMVNLDRSLRPDRSRPWKPPPGNRPDHGRDANRRWRDRRR